MENIQFSSLSLLKNALIAAENWTQPHRCAPQLSTCPIPPGLAPTSSPAASVSAPSPRPSSSSCLCVSNYVDDWLIQLCRILKSLIQTHNVSDSISSPKDRLCESPLGLDLGLDQHRQQQQLLSVIQHICDFAWEELHCGPWQNVAIEWRQLYSIAVAAKVVYQIRQICVPQSGPSPAAVRLAPSNSDSSATAVLQDHMLDTTFDSSVQAPGCSDSDSKQVSRKRKICTQQTDEMSSTMEPHRSDHIMQPVFRQLDMALLVGGPLLESDFHTLITALQSYLHHTLDHPTLQSTLRKRAHLDESSALSEPGSVHDIRTQIEQELKHSTPLLCSDAFQHQQLAVIEPPDLLSFQSQYMHAEQPIVIDGLLSDWPAFGRLSSERAWWNMNYLRRTAGVRTVPVEIGSSYMHEDWSQKMMPLSQFIDQHILGIANPQTDCQPQCDGRTPTVSSTVYLAQHKLFDQIPVLKRDILIPDYCCLAHSATDAESDDVPLDEVQLQLHSWFGPSGTVSPLHYDPDHNLLAQVVGVKFIRMFPPSCSPYLYPTPSNMMQNTSQINAERLDDPQYPLLQCNDIVRSHCIDVLLNPGQTLYIPPKWWHYVKSMSTSFSVSFWWR
jgi:Cupin-like domain